ncbi:hypothetical protein LLH06_07910 [Mucilaginibacter daejeonensis]|uniref:hypothetical protein n=1 Tax=Mucilaginibacter daejeonensis TaxID=398049 RepID=UPI001D17277D|nr:hypothetical protein [Mucilaginibacter daejeonensis]UEG54888.1 hypothetical protein LLH06_07910 [Mucilaginibacter daejeonensis]
MIQTSIEKLSQWFNGKDNGTRKWLLILSFVVIILVGWICIRFISFDAKVFCISTPVNIGSPSGELPPISSTHKR